MRSRARYADVRACTLTRLLGPCSGILAGRRFGHGSRSSPANQHETGRPAAFDNHLFLVQPLHPDPPTFLTAALAVNISLLAYTHSDLIAPARCSWASVFGRELGWTAVSPLCTIAQPYNVVSTVMRRRVLRRDVRACQAFMSHYDARTMVRSRWCIGVIPIGRCDVSVNEYCFC